HHFDAFGGVKDLARHAETVLGAHGRFEGFQRLLRMGEHEIAVLFQPDAGRVVEFLGRGLEKPYACLAEPDVELEPPLHAKAGAVSPARTAGKFALVHDEDTAAITALRHPPGTGESKRPSPHDENISGPVRHRTGLSSDWRGRREGQGEQAAGGSSSLTVRPWRGSRREP